MKALVTGASQGIGEQYATVLARDYGCDLLLVDIKDGVFAVAQRLQKSFGVTAHAFIQDLSRPDAAEAVYAHAGEIDFAPDVLVNNAGIFFFDAFKNAPMPKIEAMIMIHVLTLTKLCRLFGADMCKRGSGYILNMSSMSAWMDYPAIQLYASTKNFVLSFSKAIRYEFRPFGVHVTVATPGMVNTGLFGLQENLRKLSLRLGVGIPPEKLARKALRAMFRGRRTVIPGAINHFFKPITKHLPPFIIRAAMKLVPKLQQ